MNVENRTIFEGDNLHILRGLDSETIDLIYLDPPFNSNRTYEVPIGRVTGCLFTIAPQTVGIFCELPRKDELAEYSADL